MITLWGTYQGRTEQIDSAKGRREAEYLIREYRMAFGPDWKLWLAEEGGEEGEEGEEGGEQEGEKKED